MKKVFSSLGVFIFLSNVASAAQAPTTQSNLNLVWLGVASGLVMFMQVGFIALESGFTRAKNSVNVATKGILDFAVGSLIFFMFGFAFMFGKGSFIGTTNFLLSDYITNGDNAGIMFWVFQVMFAGAAATIVSGAVAERIKLTGYVIASAVIAGFIYPIFGHWAWSSDGWLAAMNFHDFAGSTVIHALGGWLAFTGAVVLGPRFGKFKKDGTVNAIPGHNIPLAVLGTFILWFGWYGFNGGSTLTGDGSIAIVFLNTTLGGAAGTVMAMLYSAFRTKLVDLGMTLNGALAGLVAVTAGADALSPGSAIIVGLFAGLFVSLAVPFFDKLKIDDPVGAVSVHGINGVWGTLAVGLFTKEYSFLTQLIGAVSVVTYALITGFILFILIDKIAGLRVSAEDELIGLDKAEHGYSAYPEFQSHYTSDLFK
ncbi:ammonium transporter [Haliovirga abyssi]|uniref:Ammonium transporter n=1 Tax=Haliovirga abyssi TaxID=2996794 RepID=A0AAU9DX62_9FUSO|nr:ammonium transporter [Haliovirga abyssi]BDU49925.1 ammonium transporter [Haliovirga abyssi]